MTKVLVTGGAGYIGSHTVKKLTEAGYEVVIYDNLSTGSAKAILCGDLIQGELNDAKRLTQVFDSHKFDAVLHFAASISVPESLEKPLAYYYNNTCNVVNLLQCCQQFDVNQLVFFQHGSGVWRSSGVSRQRVIFYRADQSLRQI